VGAALTSAGVKLGWPFTKPDPIPQQPGFTVGGYGPITGGKITGLRDFMEGKDTGAPSESEIKTMYDRIGDLELNLISNPQTARGYNGDWENLLDLERTVKETLAARALPVWSNYITIDGPEVWNGIYRTRSAVIEREGGEKGYLCDGILAIINKYTEWDKPIGKWAEAANIAESDRPDIARIMHLASAAPKSPMPFETDVGGALDRSADGQPKCADCPTLTQEAIVIVDKLLEMDRVQWEKYKEETSDTERESIAYDRQTIARYVARLHGDKSMDPSSPSTLALIKVSENAKRHLTYKSSETKAALYKSLKEMVYRAHFNDDPEFEPYRTFTAAQAPGADVIPEYTGDNVLLKGIHRAYRILVGR
jgi:hypothetical protein